MLPEPEPGGEVERHECVRCGRAVAPAASVCGFCLRVLEEEHAPAFRRDLRRLDLHLQFEAEYPSTGGSREG